MFLQSRSTVASLLPMLCILSQSDLAGDVPNQPRWLQERTDWINSRFVDRLATDRPSACSSHASERSWQIAKRKQWFGLGTIARVLCIKVSNVDSNIDQGKLNKHANDGESFIPLLSRQGNDVVVGFFHQFVRLEA